MLSYSPPIQEDKPAFGKYQSSQYRGPPETGLQESEYDVKAMTPEGGTYENTIFTATQFFDLGLYVCFNPPTIRPPHTPHRSPSGSVTFC